MYFSHKKIAPIENTNRCHLGIYGTQSIWPGCSLIAKLFCFYYFVFGSHCPRPIDQPTSQLTSDLTKTFLLFQPTLKISNQLQEQFRKSQKYLGQKIATKTLNFKINFLPGNSSPLRINYFVIRNRPFAHYPVFLIELFL